MLRRVSFGDASERGVPGKQLIQPDWSMVMKANVGGIDRTLRILVGLALIVWAVTGGPVWAWIGVVPLATGLFKFCPFYPLLGMSTCPARK